MSCGFAHFDGSYVLGALSAADRRDFEDHLEGCEDCSRRVRDLAGLPGLLARADVGVWEDAPVDEPMPDTLLPSLLETMRRRRRRRMLSAVAGVAAAVVAGITLVGTGVIGTPGGAGQHSSTVAIGAVARSMSPIGQDSLRATVTLTSVAWGTKLDLNCTYATYGQAQAGSVPTYALVVHTRDGRTERLATWRAVAGRTITVSAGTDLDTGQIASVEVLDGSRVPVLRSAIA